MQIIQILIFEVVTINSTVLAQCSFLIQNLWLKFTDFRQFHIYIFLHGHQQHRIKLLEIFHDGWFAELGSQIRSYVIGSVFFSEAHLIF